MDISSTLVSNSTQLDNVDLMAGPRDFTITDVKVNDSDQPLAISLAEYERPWKPGVTMRRLLAAMWGAESDSWIDHRVRLYRDEKVTFGPQATGGTRISHASHIDKTVKVTLPTSKGKFGEFTVQPLTEAAPPAEPSPEDRASKAAAWFAAKGVERSNLEAWVGLPIAEWTAEHLTELTESRESIAAELTNAPETTGGAA